MCMIYLMTSNAKTPIYLCCGRQRIHVSRFGGVTGCDIPVTGSHAYWALVTPMTRWAREAPQRREQQPPPPGRWWRREERRGRGGPRKPTIVIFLSPSILRTLIMFLRAGLQYDTYKHNMNDACQMRTTPQQQPPGRYTWGTVTGTSERRKSPSTTPTHARRWCDLRGCMGIMRQLDGRWMERLW